MAKFSSLLILSLRFLTSNAECAPVDVQENFVLEDYVTGDWFIHQQAVTQYLPVERNFCVRAQYTLRDSPTFWGYTVEVNNYAQDSNGNAFGGPLCAKLDEAENNPAKLQVAPCFLPPIVAGDYWVVAYSEEDGYALIAGGQPTVEGPDGCSSPDSSGLWIFSRRSVRDVGLIELLRSIAKDKGFDLSVLNDVDHTECNGYPEVPDVAVN